MAKMKIVEVPIPTHYGDEICYVNGTKYAYNIIKASIHSRLQQMGIYYKREYDLDQNNIPYRLKAGYQSSHTMLLDQINAGSKVLEIGQAYGLITKELIKKGCVVNTVDPNMLLAQEKTNKLNQTEFVYDEIPPADSYDVIVLMDILETLDQPEILLDVLRDRIKLSTPEIYLSVANIGFFITRLQLLFGAFNYGKRGILDFNHKRLFTKKSIYRLCEQSGMTVEKIQSVPAPFPEAMGLNTWSKALLSINKGLIYVSRGLFTYEYLIKVKAKPIVKNLIKHSIQASDIRKQMHAV